MRTAIFKVLINLLFLSIFLRMGMPYSKYLYFPVVLITFLYTPFCISFSIKKIFSSVKVLLLPIALLLWFVIALVQTKPMHSGQFKEAIDMLCIVMIGLVLLFSTYILPKETLWKILVRVAIFSTFFLAILGITKFILELFGVYFPFVFYASEYPLGTSLLPDYNFFACISIIGIIFTVYNIFTEQIRIKKNLVVVILTTLTVVVSLSTSRRGIIILGTIYVIFTIYMWVSYYKNARILNATNLYKGKIGLLIKSFTFILVFYVLLFGFFFCTNSEFRVKSIRKSGLNLLSCQNYFTTLFVKYGTILGISDANYAFSYLWQDSLNPKVPESGWGNGDYHLVRNLQSTGLFNVPNDAIGIRIDNSCNYFRWEGRAYYHSNLRREYLRKDIRYFASIYCFVSQDFNGDKVFMRIIQKGVIDKYKYYNFNEKGTWQKLTIEFHGENEIANLELYIGKVGMTSFKQFNGHVTFAYPEFRSIKFSPEDPITWVPRDECRLVYPLIGKNVNILPSNAKGHRIDRTSPFFYIKKPTYRYASSIVAFGDSLLSTKSTLISEVYCYVSDDFDGSKAMLCTIGGVIASKYDMTQKGRWQKLSIKVKGNNSRALLYMYVMKEGVTDFTLLNGYVIFAYPTYRIVKKDLLSIATHQIVPIPLSNNHLIRASVLPSFNISNNFSLSNRQVSMDSTIVFTQQYNLDMFAGNRLDRWRFGWYIYKQKYTIIQKLFGGGLGYMHLFADEFLDKNSDKLDYPHNPFISVLLYSGIIGLCLYLWFIGRCIYLYILFRKDYWPLLVCFTIVFFFSMFSANNPFDPSIMGFFTVLPFFIHYIHQKDNLENEK